MNSLDFVIAIVSLLVGMFWGERRSNARHRYYAMQSGARHRNGLSASSMVRRHGYVPDFLSWGTEE